jgi:hypothetical protein
VSLGLARGDFTLHRVSASEQRDSRHLDFDELTVHRINIVEPDGTPRLIISDKAEFAGEFYHEKEISRPDRQDSAGIQSSLRPQNLSDQGSMSNFAC